jgi:hypothetical protein
MSEADKTVRAMHITKIADAAPDPDWCPINVAYHSNGAHLDKSQDPRYKRQNEEVRAKEGSSQELSCEISDECFDTLSASGRC